MRPLCPPRHAILAPALALAVAASTPAIARALPPANDQCAGALTVPCGGRIVFDNFDAFTDATDPEFSCRIFGPAPGVATMWFRFVPTSAIAEVSLCNPGTIANDTLLAVYSGTCNNPVEIGCNDDACGFFGLTSRVTVTDLIPGQPYLIQVASWDDANLGAMELSVACAAPDADECATAPLIASAGSSFYDALALSVDQDDPDSPCDNAADPASTAWFRFIATSADVRIGTCAPGTQLLQTAITLFEGPCSDLTQVQCNDDGGLPGCGPTGHLASLVAHGLTIGQTYTVLVYSYIESGAEPGGNVELVIDPLFEMDDIEVARPVTCGETVLFNNSTFTLAPTDPFLRCEYGIAMRGHKTAWFSYTAQRPDARISLCNPGSAAIDTLIGIVDRNGVVLTCNDDAVCSRFGFLSILTARNLIPGETYSIEVAGFSTFQAGPLEMSVSCFDFTCPCPPDAITENEPDCGAPVDTVNGGCLTFPPVFTPIECNQTICGAIGGTGQTEGSDTDWYEVVTTEVASLTWTVASEVPLVIGFVAGSGPGDCDRIGSLNPMAFTDDVCTPVSVTVPNAPPGRLWWFIAPAPSVGPVTCGATYTATLSGGPCSQSAFDRCATARPIACGESFTFNSSDLTAVPSDPAYSCHVGGPRRGIYTAWFAFTASGTQADISLCNPGTFVPDTLLALYRGTCDAPIEIACNDDGLVPGCGAYGYRSRFTATGLVPGETYLIQTANWAQTQPGQMELAITCSTPVVDCNANGVSDAQDIASGFSRDCFSAAAAPGTRGGPNAVPDECECLPDWNRDTVVNSTDVSDFINTFFLDQITGSTSGDVDCNAVTNSTDVSDFINTWFAAQAGQLPFAGCAI